MLVGVRRLSIKVNFVCMAGMYSVSVAVATSNRRFRALKYGYILLGQKCVNCAITQ